MPRIVRFARHGGPEVLEIRDEPLEEPRQGEVRLEIESFGLNRGETMFRAGADHVVVTEEEDLESRVKEITGGRGFTIAYDPVGGAFIGDLVAAAQPCGTIVSYGNLRTEPIDIPILPMLAKRLDIKFHSVFDTVRLPEKRAACLAFVQGQVAAGALTPIVDRIFPLEEIVDAHRYMESNMQRGKIVVTT